jgi:hypothetical protein
MEEEKPSKNEEKSDMVDRAMLAILNTDFKYEFRYRWGPAVELERELADSMKFAMERHKDALVRRMMEIVKENELIPGMIEPIKKSKRQEAVDGPENKRQNKRWLHILLRFCRRTD